MVDETKKQTLTENLIKFMEGYGFTVEVINVNIKNVSSSGSELEYEFNIKAKKSI